MTATTTMTEDEYLRFVLTDPDEKWELHDGRLVCKPPMTWEHIRTAALIHSDLQQQLGRGEYIVISEAGRLRRDERHYYVPDVIVVPVARARGPFRERSEGRCV